MAITIAAIGDAAFLREVLNGVAMVFATDDIKDLVKVGFMLGLLLVGLRGIMKASMEIQHLLLAFIIYAVMFGPKVDEVEIYDPYTSISYTVDNVPLGVAYTGKLLSAVGIGLTELMEQAYSPVDPAAGTYKGILEEGFLDPLKLLINVRYVPYNPKDPLGQSTHFNVQNHVMSCTALFIMAGRLDEDKIPVAENLWDAIKVDSPVLTQLYKDPVGGYVEEKTCSEVRAELDALFSSAPYQELIVSSLNTYLNFPKDAGGSPPPAPHEELRSYAESLIGVAGDSFNHVNNQIMIHSAMGGLQKFGAQHQDLAYALSIQTAKQRRDFTHAAESSMFMNIMRPMMSFLESIVYALSPLMAFLVVIGPQGIGIAGKYLLLTVWMQLWLPILSVVKLYVYMSAHSELSGLMDTYGNIESLEAAWMFQDKLQSYLGISGLLVGMVPVIALMLISGGAVTANAIASRLTSTASGAASTAAGVMTPMPVSSSAGTYKSANMEGVSDVRNGGGVMMGMSSPGTQTKLSMGASQNRQLQAMEQHAHSTGVESAATSTQSLMQTEGFKTLSNAARTNNWSEAAQWQQTYNSNLEKVKQANAASKSNLSEEAQSQLAAVMTGTVAAGTPRMLGTSIGVEGAIQGRSVQGDKVGRELSDALQNGVAKRFAEQLSSSVKKDAAFTQQLTAASSTEDGITRSMASVRQQAAKSQSTVMESQSATTALSSMQGLNTEIPTSAFQGAAAAYYSDRGQPASDPVAAGDRFGYEYNAAVQNLDFQKMADMQSYMSPDTKRQLGAFASADLTGLGRPSGMRSSATTLDRSTVDGSVSGDRSFEARAGYELARGQDGVASQGTPSVDAVTQAVGQNQERFAGGESRQDANYEGNAQALRNQAEAQRLAAGAGGVGRISGVLKEGIKYVTGDLAPGGVLNEATDRAARATHGASNTAAFEAMAAASPNDQGLQRAAEASAGTSGAWRRGSPEEGKDQYETARAVFAAPGGSVDDSIRGDLPSEQYSQAQAYGLQVQAAEYDRRAALISGDTQGAEKAEDRIRSTLTEAAGGNEAAGERAFQNFMSTQGSIARNAEAQTATQLLKNSVESKSLDSVPSEGDAGRAFRNENISIAQARDFISGASGDSPQVTPGMTNEQAAQQFEDQARGAAQAVLLGGRQPSNVDESQRPDFSTTPTRGLGDAVYAGTAGGGGGIGAAPSAASPVASAPAQTQTASVDTQGGQAPSGGAGQAYGSNSNSSRDAGPGVSVPQGNIPEASIQPSAMQVSGQEHVSNPDVITPMAQKAGDGPSAEPFNAGFIDRGQPNDVIAQSREYGSAEGRELASALRDNFGPSGSGRYTQTAGSNVVAEGAAGMEIGYQSAQSVGMMDSENNITPAGATVAETAQADVMSDPALAAQAEAAAEKDKRKAQTDPVSLAAATAAQGRYPIGVEEPSPGKADATAVPQASTVAAANVDAPAPAAGAPPEPQTHEGRIAIEALRQIESNTGIPVLSNLSDEDIRDMNMDRAREIAEDQAPGVDFDRANQYAETALFNEEMRNRFGT